jgi:hypothetical protein
MTSVAFILGLLPLGVATRAAELSRRAVGTVVFGGILAASSIGICMVPMLFVTFRRLRERVKADFQPSLKAEGAHDDCYRTRAPRNDGPAVRFLMRCSGFFPMAGHRKHVFNLAQTPISLSPNHAKHRNDFGGASRD